MQGAGRDGSGGVRRCGGAASSVEDPASPASLGQPGNPAMPRTPTCMTRPDLTPGAVGLEQQAVERYCLHHLQVLLRLQAAPVYSDAAGVGARGGRNDAPGQAAACGSIGADGQTAPHAAPRHAHLSFSCCRICCSSARLPSNECTTPALNASAGAGQRGSAAAVGGAAGEARRRSSHTHRTRRRTRTYVRLHDLKKVVGGGAQVQEHGQAAGACQLKLPRKAAALRVGVAKVEAVIVQPRLPYRHHLAVGCAIPQHRLQLSHVGVGAAGIGVKLGAACGVHAHRAEQPLCGGGGAGRRSGRARMGSRARSRRRRARRSPGLCAARLRAHHGCEPTPEPRAPPLDCPR